MKKSLNLLVALALVFSLLTPAMAFAATSQESAAGAKLQQYGVLSGGTDGDLMLDADLKREDMIVLLSRLLGAEEEAKAHENNHGFTDVDNPFYDSYISWAKAEGLTQGIGNDRFGQNTNLKLKDLLQFQLRVLGYDDVAYDDVPAKAEELGLVEEGLDAEAPVTRGQMALVTLNALNTEVNGEGILLGAKLEIDEFIPDVGILSLNAVGAKKLQVKFASAVDTDEAEITVKRGANSVSVAETKWSENNTLATIETSSRLIEGTYEVVVTGYGEEEVKATVEVESEKVAAIEILGDVAPISRDAANFEKVDVHYVVKNQYDENVTKLQTVQATSPSGTTTIDTTNGVVTIDKHGTTDFHINETVVLTLIHIEDAVTATKTLTVGNKAAVSEIVVTELYNQDEDAVLNVDSTMENFKLVVEAKDQYGNAVTNPTHVTNEVVASVAGQHIVDIDWANKVQRKANFVTEEINGEDKVVVALDDATNNSNVKTAGTAVVTLISATSGKSSNFNIVVAEGVVVDQLILGSVGAIVAAGEDIKVPVTAIDKNGEPITDVDVLKNAQADSRIFVNPTGATFKKENGQIYLVTQAPTNVVNTQTVFFTALSETGKSSQQTVTVREAAVPKVISGLKDVSGLIFKGENLTLEPKHIKVEDQYGREMSTDKFKDDFLVAGTDYTITVTGATYTDTTVAVTSSTLAHNTNIVFNGADKGSKRITFTLNDGNGDAIAGSDFTTSIRTVVLDELKTFEFANIDSIYTHTAYAATVKVTGKTADGKSVELPASAYTVVTDTTTVDPGTTNKLDTVGFATHDDEENTFKAIVTIIGNGEVLEQEVTATQKAPKANSVAIKNDGALNDGVWDVTTATSLDITDLKLEVKDQYGKEAASFNVVGGNEQVARFLDGSDSVAPTLTISNIDVDTATVTNNGKNNAAISGLKAGDKFTITVRYGTATASVDVVVE